MWCQSIVVWPTRRILRFWSARSMAVPVDYQRPNHQYLPPARIWSSVDTESIALGLDAISHMPKGTILNVFLTLSYVSILIVEFIFRKSPLANQATPIPQSSNAPSDTWFPLRFAMEINSADELKIQTIKVDTESEKSHSETSSATPLDETKSLHDSLPTSNRSTNSTPSSRNTTSPASSSSKSKKRTYNLSAVVCQITEGNQTHLVSLIYVSAAYHRMKPEPLRSTPGQWYVFNDFNINPIQLDEAPWYTLEWKVPCVLFYTSTDMPEESTEVHRETLVNPFIQVCWNEKSLLMRIQSRLWCMQLIHNYICNN